jgi:hypothetical protein
MSRLILSCLFAFAVITAMPGCGSDAPTNVAEDADAQAIADYEAMVAEESAGMDKSDN